MKHLLTKTNLNNKDKMSEERNSDDLQNYMKSINPQKHEQAILIYGSKYRCYLQGKDIGIWTWTQDENIGDSFQNIEERDGERYAEVATPDKWELIITKP